MLRFIFVDECDVRGLILPTCLNMKADPKQFRVALPISLIIDIKSNINGNMFTDYKYYLAENSEDEIKSIVTFMSFAKKEGKTVKYRIHPRYTDLNILKKHVSNEEIELPQEVSIIDSISNIEYAVGSYTTVLLQAYMSGQKVILDDVTYKERYNQLKEYEYILVNRGLTTLSSKQF